MARRGARALVVLAAVILWVGIARLGMPADDEPVSIALETSRGVPIWLYVPGEPDDDDFLEPPERGEAPPVVVLGHGFSGDRRVMHTLASALARSGYAAASIDFRGHGENPHAFRGDVADDLVEVVDTLQRSPWVDPKRVALLGHSMGASAVVGAGAHDDRVSAVIAISGSRITPIERPPPNVLFLVAERDPERIHQSTTRAADRIAERRVAVGSTAGSSRRGDAVRVVEVDGTDHLSVIFAEDTGDEVVRWLDATFDLDSREVDLGSRYAGVGLPFLAAIVLLAAIGLVAGRRGSVVVAGGAPLVTLAALAGALVLALPVVRMANVASFLPLVVADTLFSYLVIVAALLALVMHRRLVPIGAQLGASILPALAAFGAIFIVLAPLLGNFHRVTPTPKRFLAFVIGAAICIPFFLVVENLIRRGSPWVAAVTSATARVLVLAAIIAGAARGFLPGVVGLVVPILVATFVLFEVFAAAAYIGGRNTTLIGFVEGLWLAWLVSVFLPITI